MTSPHPDLLNVFVRPMRPASHPQEGQRKRHDTSKSQSGMPGVGTDSAGPTPIDLAQPLMAAQDYASNSGVFTILRLIWKAASSCFSQRQL